MAAPAAPGSSWLVVLAVECHRGDAACPKGMWHAHCVRGARRLEGSSFTPGLSRCSCGTSTQPGAERGVGEGTWHVVDTDSTP